MTKDEIIEDLITKGIVDKIGETYFVTEKYKEVLAQIGPKIALPAPIQPIDNYDALLNSKSNGGDWPIEIQELKGRARAAAVMDACEVPSTSPDGTYRLRGLSTKAVNIVSNLVVSKDVDGATFIAAAKFYYKHTEKPKSFKNFIIEGDALDVYNEYVTGALQKSTNITKTDQDGWR